MMLLLPRAILLADTEVLPVVTAGIGTLPTAPGCWPPLPTCQPGGISSFLYLLVPLQRDGISNLLYAGWPQYG